MALAVKFCRMGSQLFGCVSVLLLSEGQMSDHKGARLMLPALPPGG
jgi:hypothetical protein